MRVSVFANVLLLNKKLQLLLEFFYGCGLCHDGVYNGALYIE
ncbi:MAG: hypothetical protein RLY58_55 [Pseudomonadota bacterium]|jgi:hypothetical protein